MVYHLEGALASSLAARQARIDQHSCFLLATNALDDAQLPPQAVVAGYKGQGHAERGCRFLQAPPFFASSRYRKKPERIMALLMVMTGCVLVYAALESRIRTALKEQDATFPDHKGKPVQHPTARWVFHYFVGMHVLLIPGQWYPLVVHLTEKHQSLLRLLGKPYERWYRCIFTKMKGAVRNGGCYVADTDAKAQEEAPPFIWRMGETTRGPREYFAPPEGTHALLLGLRLQKTWVPHLGTCRETLEVTSAWQSV